MPNENENLVDETVQKIVSFESLQDAFERYDAEGSFSGDYLDLENTPLQLQSEATPASGHYWGRDMPLGSTWFPNTTREIVNNNQWYAWYYTYGSVDYQKQTYLTHWIPMIYQICQEAGCPVTVSDVVDWTTVATNFPVKFNHVSYQATVKYEYTSSHYLGYQIEIPNKIIITVFSSATEPGEFVVDGINAWTIHFVLPSIPSNESILLEVDTRVPAVPAVWESDSNLEIWGNISDKPTLATVATSGDYDDLTDKPDIPEDRLNRTLIGFRHQGGLCDFLNYDSSIQLFKSYQGQHYVEDGCRLRLYNGWGGIADIFDAPLQLMEPTTRQALTSGLSYNRFGPIAKHLYTDMTDDSSPMFYNYVHIPNGCYGDFVYVRQNTNSAIPFPDNFSSEWSSSGLPGSPAIWMLESPRTYSYLRTVEKITREGDVHIIAVRPGTNFVLQRGTKLNVKFKHASNGTAYLGIAPIKNNGTIDESVLFYKQIYDGYRSESSSDTPLVAWEAGDTIELLFDGESFRILRSKFSGVPMLDSGTYVAGTASTWATGGAYTQYQIDGKKPPAYYEVEIRNPSTSTHDVGVLVKLEDPTNGTLWSKWYADDRDTLLIPCVHHMSISATSIIILDDPNNRSCPDGLEYRIKRIPVL